MPLSREVDFCSAAMFMAEEILASWSSVYRGGTDRPRARGIGRARPRGIVPPGLSDDIVAMTFPPRIHVLMARDAPVGVVIRRGPSKSVCTILWDRRRDTFQVGQCLRGRIYERRSDLSPDGKYLIYFAMNGRWSGEAKGSWTAISRAPYLKAIALFPKGDCWNGGGLFTGNKRYWLNQGYGHLNGNDTREVLPDEKFRPEGGVGNECLGVYYPRLLRDGWQLIERSDVDVFEKPVGRGWVLRKLAHAEIVRDPGKGCYWDEHELMHAQRGLLIDLPKWEWAELDGTRLVWATGGALYAGRVNAQGLCDEVVLADFSGMKFEAVAGPY